MFESKDEPPAPVPSNQTTPDQPPVSAGSDAPIPEQPAASAERGVEPSPEPGSERASEHLGAPEAETRNQQPETGNQPEPAVGPVAGLEAGTRDQEPETINQPEPAVGPVAGLEAGTRDQEPETINQPEPAVEPEAGLEAETRDQEPETGNKPKPVAEPVAGLEAETRDQKPETGNQPEPVAEPVAGLEAETRDQEPETRNQLEPVVEHVAGLEAETRDQEPEARDQKPPARPGMFSSLPDILFILILAAGVGLRLFGLDWDNGYMFHPDERAILMKVAGGLTLPANFDQFLDPTKSPLNPHWFPYGSFPLYLLKFVSAAFAFVHQSFAGLPDMRLVGRALSALFDTATIIAVFVLGSRMYNRRAGLLAAAFVAFTVLDIQLSHFYAVDTIVTFFAVLTVLFSWDIAERCSLRSAALAGLSLGLALATKVSSFPLFVPVAVAFYLAYVRRKETATHPLVRPVFGIIIAVLVALGAFAATEPYAFLDSKSFIADTVEQSEMVRRVRDYPYTRQYENTPPYLYSISQLAEWGMGLPLGTVAWAGVALALGLVIFRRKPADMLILSWVVPYFLITGAFQVKFMRYLLPIAPFLCLLGARLLMSWNDEGRRVPLIGSLSAKIVIAFVLASSILYSFAYMNIYLNPHPAVEISKWINANAPKGSTIAKEHWEEGIPRLDGYKHVELNLYENDDANKLRHIVERLTQADYVVFYSNRLYGTIPRLAQRYPMTSNYYRLLFTEELGFKLEAVAYSYPSLFGVTIVDDTFSRPNLPAPGMLEDFKPTATTIDRGYADESFTVYDHPKVLVFKKTKPIPPAELTAILEVPGLGAPPRKPGLLLSEGDLAANRAGGTWAEIFPRDSFTNQFPALSWLLLVEVISLAALPLTVMLFRRLPDHGYLLAKPLGILIVAYLTWLAASLHVVAFTPGTVLIALGLLALPSVVLGIRFRGELLAFIRQRWGIVAVGEAVFLLAFLGFYVIRLLNPDLWHPYRGGEKPMDFAYLNAIIKTTYLPPYDPWLSGGYLNYYYLGQFVVATLIKVLGIIPAVGYNLAVPLLFAMTTAGAFSVVYNLVEKARGEAGSRAGISRGPVLAAVAAALLLGVLGNVDGLYQILEGFWRVGEPFIKGSAPPLTEGSRFISGLGKVFIEHKDLPSFDFWRSSRMMPPTISITEFPFFSFLFADLHAHLIAMPFGVLASALGLNLVLGRWGEGASTFSLAALWRRLPGLLAFSLVLGALRWTNSWDFPTYFLLATAAIFVSELISRRGPAVVALGWWALGTGLLYVFSSLFFLPFQMNYQSFYDWVQPSAERTPLVQYFSIHALFLLIVISYLLWQLQRGLRLLPLILSALLASGVFAFIYIVLRLETVAFLAALLALVLTLLVQKIASREAGDEPGIFVLVLMGIAFALGIGVDIITIQGDINRMNTVFKFYLQAWVLFSLVAGFALWHLLRLRWRGRRVWLAGLVFLFLASAIYPIGATPVRVRDRFNSLSPTDDGMAYMKTAVYGDEKGKIDLARDYEAIRWIQDNIPGSPVMLEGITPLYRWGSRISVYTGLPTVVGWDNHQNQQRKGYQWMVDERLRDVRLLYTADNPGTAVSLLRKYDVKYIYVGQVERLYFPAAGVDKFEKMVGQYLDVVYQNEEVKIYKVKEGAT